MVVLVGFSLEMAAHVIISMAEYCLCGLTCIEVVSRSVMRKIESNTPSWLLALLHCGRPSVGVPEHPRGSGKVVVCCCSFDLNLI
jgi:hypothetical protein